MNLILLHSDDFREGGIAELSDARARHIREVLKAEPGKVLRVGLLNGALGRGTVLSVGEGAVRLACGFDPEPPARPRADLLLAMPRPKVVKRLWAQLAALGVGRIVLVNAEKVERFYFDSHVLDPAFYTRRLVEGLQQARCTHLPDVQVRRRFRPFVEDELEALFPGSVRLLADPSGERRLSGFSFPENRRVLLAVGPEGGWSPFEIELLRARGFELFGLGRRILRTDTACVALLGILSELCG